MWTVFDVAAFVAGFAVCWVVKDRAIRVVSGPEAFVKALEAKVAALKAAL